MGSYRLRSFFVLYPCIHSLSCDYTYASIVLYLPFWSKPPCPCLCIIITDKIHIWFLSYIAQSPEHPTLTSSVLMKFWTSMKSDAWKLPAFSSFHWSALLTASSTNLPLVPTIPTHNWRSSSICFGHLKVLNCNWSLHSVMAWCLAQDWLLPIVKYLLDCPTDHGLSPSPSQDRFHQSSKVVPTIFCTLMLFKAMYSVIQASTFATVWSLQLRRSPPRRISLCQSHLNVKQGQWNSVSLLVKQGKLRDLSLTKLRFVVVPIVYIEW